MLLESRLRSFYNGKKALIPGGAGFIGSGLAKRLVSYGAEVTVVDSFDVLCGGNHANIKEIRRAITLVRGKIENFIGYANINRYDIIFNCIGLTNHHITYADIEKDYSINCRSGLRLLQQLVKKRSSCRMISIGSRGQYGKTDRVGIDEACPMSPLDAQAIHKITLENYHSLFARRHELDLLYVRLTNVYGPGQRLRGKGVGVLGEIIRDSISGEEITIYGSADRIKDIVFIEDVVDAILLLGTVNKKGSIIYNVGGNPCKLRDIIEAISEKIELKVRILPFPDSMKTIDTGDSVLNAGLLKKDAGWAPKTAVREGMAVSMDYYQKHKKDYL